MYKILEQCGAQEVLTSYYYLREKSEKTIERVLTNFDKVFLDSGAFTLRQSIKDEFITDVDWEYVNKRTMEYINNYIDFIKKYGDRFELIAEVDVGGWQQKTRYREHLETELPDTQILPVVHRKDPDRYVEYLCKNYPYVAFATLHGYGTDEVRNYMNKRMKIARKYGTPIHGFGLTTFEFMKTLGMASVDSVTWLMGSKHGMTFWFDGKKLHFYDNTEKWTRVRMKEEVKEMGLDWDLFMDDKAAVVNRFNCYQWVQFQNYLKEEGQGIKKFKTAQEKFWREAGEDAECSK